MAGKKGRKKGKPSPEPGPGVGDARERLIDAALRLAAERGWREVGLVEIAEAAGLGIGEAYALHGSKLGILSAFRRRIDRTVLAGTAVNRDEPWRDRLFDVLMRRFDALQPHRPALKAIMRDSLGDPAMLWGVPGFIHSMAWMLEAAGISAVGLRGRLRTQLLAGLYLSLMRLFLRDDSADLTATMAALDRRLRAAGSFFGGQSAGRE